MMASTDVDRFPTLCSRAFNIFRDEMKQGHRGSLRPSTEVVAGCHGSPVTLRELTSALPTEEELGAAMRRLAARARAFSTFGEFDLPTVPPDQRGLRISDQERGLSMRFTESTSLLKIEVLGATLPQTHARRHDTKLAARSLLALAREHKAVCESPDCGVSLFALRQVYGNLVGRPLTDEERQAFISPARGEGRLNLRRMDTPEDRAFWASIAPAMV